MANEFHWHVEFIIWIEYWISYLTPPIALRYVNNMHLNNQNQIRNIGNCTNYVEYLPWLIAVVLLLLVFLHKSKIIKIIVANNIIAILCIRISEKKYTIQHKTVTLVIIRVFGTQYVHLIILMITSRIKFNMTMKPIIEQLHSLISRFINWNNEPYQQNQCVQQ